MSRLPVVLLSLCAVCPSGGVVSAAPVQELPRLLDVMARVASLYADAALAFTCREQMTDSRFRSQGRLGQRESYRFDYFYVFNDDPEAGTIGLQDYRTHQASDGEAVEPVRIEPGDLGVAAHLTRAYSWIFLFRPNLRAAMSFRLEPEDEALGRAARVVSFAPIADAPAGTPTWAGRMWIDRETYQLLRVEAVKSDAYLAARPLPDGGERQFLFTRAEVEFEFEKHGLRFPTKATVEGRLVALEPPYAESYVAQGERLLERGMPFDVMFRVVQEYRDYRFFGVRTADEVERAVRGIQPE